MCCLRTLPSVRSLSSDRQAFGDPVHPAEARGRRVGRQRVAAVDHLKGVVMCPGMAASWSSSFAAAVGGWNSIPSTAPLPDPGVRRRGAGRVGRGDLELSEAVAPMDAGLHDRPLRFIPLRALSAFDLIVDSLVLLPRLAFLPPLFDSLPHNPTSMHGLVDGNNFYASCERVFNPSLRGRPGVVLSNNDGCTIARSRKSRTWGLAWATHPRDPAGLAEAAERVIGQLGPLWRPVLAVGLNPEGPLSPSRGLQHR